MIARIAFNSSQQPPQRRALLPATTADPANKMLCLPSSSAFRPADPAARGAMASQQQRQSFPHASTAARGMLSFSSAVPSGPADPAAQQQDFRMREFDYFVVVDFEATCEKDSRIYPQEIIEFPAVLVDAATGGLLSSFRTYVKPRHHPVLTAFCSELTGIQQEQVDGGVDLATALALHDKWLAAAGVAKNRLAIVTWGDWDCRTMLKFECNFKNISKPSYFNQWVNLRIPFETAFGAGRRNLQEAVREAGLQWDGRLHCGLDDARNTARLLVELMRRGVRISITGSLVPPPLPEPEPEPEQEPELQHQRRCGDHTRTNARTILLRLWELDADMSFLPLGCLIAGHLDSIASSALRLASYYSLIHTHGVHA
uniref:Exonuclease domain-containing protein n=2 Tax=Setaria italica TaxID=4555 RepID=K3ZUF1_SETIT